MFDHPSHDVETEARTAADRLGGEERVEDLRLYVFGHARAVVDDRYDNRTAFSRDANGNVPTLAHSIERVVDQVRPNLIQLGAEGRNTWNVVRDLERYVRRLLAGLGVEQHHRVAQSRSEIERLRRGGAVHVGKPLHGRHQLVNARSGTLHVGGKGAGRPIRRAPT